MVMLVVGSNTFHVKVPHMKGGTLPKRSTSRGKGGTLPGGIHNLRKDTLPVGGTLRGNGNTSLGGWYFSWEKGTSPAEGGESHVSVYLSWRGYLTWGGLHFGREKYVSSRGCTTLLSIVKTLTALSTGPITKI